MSVTPDIEPFFRRAARPWRWVLLAYALALTTGTHWPEFRIAPEIPTTDKALHFAAFGGLAFLLWQTRWFRRRWHVLVVTVAWAGLDEITQGLPFLNRFVTWEDFLCAALGALVVTCGLWALRPVGADASRRRTHLHAFAFDRLFMRPRTWLVLTSIGLAGSLPPLIAWSLAGTAATRTVMLVSILLAVFAVQMTLFVLWRRECVAVAAGRLCLHCETPCGALSFDELGTGVCPGCGATVHRGQWTEPPRPSRRALAHSLVLPAVIALAGIAVIVFAIALSPIAYAFLIDAPIASGTATRTSRLFGTNPAFLRKIDLTACLLLLGLTTSIYRSRLARYYDAGVRCRVCRHDLRGAPTDRGVGRCGECGTEFVVTGAGRGEDRPPAEDSAVTGGATGEDRAPDGSD